MTAVLEPPIDLSTIKAALSCPTWCELPADHDHDRHSLDRKHMAAMFEIPGKIEISLCQVIFFEDGGLDLLHGAASPPEVDVNVIGLPLTDKQCVQVAGALQRVYAKLAEITGQAGR